MRYYATNEDRHGNEYIIYITCDKTINGNLYSLRELLDQKYNVLFSLPTIRKLVELHKHQINGVNYKIHMY